MSAGLNGLTTKAERCILGRSVVCFPSVGTQTENRSQQGTALYDKARMYFGIASNDDLRQPDAKDKLKEVFAAANVPAEIEVYPGALHGWCVPDMPVHNGMPIYSKPDAERAGANWSLFTKGLSRGLKSRSPTVRR